VTGNVTMKPFKPALLAGWDALSWVLAAGAFVLVRHDFDLSANVWREVVVYTLTAIVLQIGIGFRTHLYLGRSRIGSFDETTMLAFVVGAVAAIGAGVALAFERSYSRGLLVLVPVLALLLMAFGRWAYRGTADLRRRPTGTEEAISAVVYGAGDAGHQIAQLVDLSDEPPYRILAFVDDDPAKRFLRVRGRRVVGRGDALIEVARQHGAKAVILAITKAEPALLQEVADQCQVAGLEFVVVPPVRELIGGRVELEQLRAFNIADLLGRDTVQTDLSAIAGLVSGQVVLVTGAGGSIGSELSRQVHRLQPARLILLDRDESALHALELSLFGTGLLNREEMVLCDLRDESALAAVFELHQPDVVFHAAALKHLPMLERFPAEGWKTNVLGTLHVLRCAARFGVRHVVNVSTDKAADPTSVLGRTKRLAERLTAHYAGVTGEPWVSVRFGNVLGSRGSVLETFRAQIDQGGPVTVTHPDVTRYFMTIPEACELVLQAATLGDRGEVLVLDMGRPVRIVDVAKRLIAESRSDISIEYTGLRHGEKLHEVLLSDLEVAEPSSHERITRVVIEGVDPQIVEGMCPGTQTSLTADREHQTH